MSDRLYLSLWLKQASPLTQRSRFADLMGAFPFSRLSTAGLLTVHAISFQEAPLDELALDAIDLSAIDRRLQEHGGPDVAFELEASWDLLVPQDNDYKLTPTRVKLLAFGREFDRDPDDDLRIEFGPETPFLPKPNGSGGYKAAEANLRSLLKLVRDVEAAVPVRKKLLWTDSGGDFAARVAKLSGPE